MTPFSIYASRPTLREPTGSVAGSARLMRNLMLNN
jgi:hypothetical protein